MANAKVVKPLATVEVIGKRGTKEPFSIRLQRGLYLYIETEQFQRLKQINEAYGSIYKGGVAPLEHIRIAGRGGIMGYRPFLLKGRKGRYLCIHMVDLKQLTKINAAYEKHLEEERKRELEEKRRAEELRRKEAERKRYLEEKRKRAEEAIKRVRKAVADAKDVKALKYVPERMQEIDGLLRDVEKAFEAAKYRETARLTSTTQKLAEQAKAEAQRMAEAERVGGRYVYCVVPSTGVRKSFGNIGIEHNSEVYTVNYKDVAAVVSNVPMGEYSPTEDYSRAHEGVARTVLEECSVVPAAFGQIFKNEKILRTLMRKAHKTLRETLRLVDDKIELGVKAVLPKYIVKSLDEDKRNGIKKSSSEIFNALNKKAAQSAKGRLFSDRLSLNASFLVDRDKLDEFSNEVGRLGKKNKDLKIKYSGPWPPYSFVYIKISAKGVEVGKREVR